MIGSSGASPVAPVDLAQAAIGPGMEVFSRYAQVLESNGAALGVREALVLINRAIDEYFEEDGAGDAESDFCMFKQTDCDNYATPSALNFTLIGCLEDERDGKLYEVRKFADGKCWMVDNLAYGGDSAHGGSDACAQREELRTGR